MAQVLHPALEAISMPHIPDPIWGSPFPYHDGTWGINGTLWHFQSEQQAWAWIDAQPQWSQRPGISFSTISETFSWTFSGQSKNLMGFIRNNKCGDFKPIPFFNETGNILHWFWKDEDSYAEPIRIDGKWAGSIYKNMDTEEITGICIHLEAIPEQVLKDMLLTKLNQRRKDEISP
jgi:hypothetical protein